MQASAKASLTCVYPGARNPSEAVCWLSVETLQTTKRDSIDSFPASGVQYAFYPKYGDFRLEALPERPGVRQPVFGCTWI